jgi:hypothetical protein
MRVTRLKLTLGLALERREVLLEEKPRSFLLSQLYAELLQSSSSLPLRYLFVLPSLPCVRYPEGLSLKVESDDPWVFEIVSGGLRTSTSM